MEHSFSIQASEDVRAAEALLSREGVSSTWVLVCRILAPLSTAGLVKFRSKLGKTRSKPRLSPTARTCRSPKDATKLSYLSGAHRAASE